MDLGILLDLEALLIQVFQEYRLHLFVQMDRQNLMVQEDQHHLAAQQDPMDQVSLKNQVFQICHFLHVHQEDQKVQWVLVLLYFLVILKVLQVLLNLFDHRYLLDLKCLMDLSVQKGQLVHGFLYLLMDQTNQMNLVILVIQRVL